MSLHNLGLLRRNCDAGHLPMEFSRTLTASDGARLAYRLWRPARSRGLLILLHGLASNATRWSEFVATTSLRENWDILRPDLRGQGASVHRGRMRMDVWCDDLAAIVNAEPHETVVVVGHCFGANIALEFGRRRPKAAAGLVLIEPIFAEALRGGLGHAARWRGVLAPVVTIVRGLNALGLYRRRLKPLDLEALDRETRAAIAAGNSQVLLERYASPWEDLACIPLGVYLQALLALVDGVGDLSDVAAPTLTLLSSGGAYGDPAVVERRLAELPHGEIVVIDAEHWIPMERPVEMRRAIEAWLDRHPRQ